MTKIISIRKSIKIILIILAIIILLERILIKVLLNLVK